MSLRGKFFRAMRREDDAYVPFEFTLCPALVREFGRRTGAEDYVEYYRFPTRTCHLEYIGDYDRFRPYHASQEGLRLDDWGVGHRAGSVAHFTKMEPPMQAFTGLREFQEYPYPDPVTDYDWAVVPKQVRAIQERDLIAVGPMETTIFERAWYMRGMDRFMMDMVLAPELAHYHLERICEIKCEWARRFARAGVDVLRLGDDVSTQIDMMISPETWREFIKPRLARVIAAAQAEKPDILIFYHGDGNLQRIIPDLIEVGVQILNPLQPECMDPVAIKQEYGDRLSFWGGLGTQSTMPFGTPAEVTETCRRLIREVGRGGGFFLAPTHVLEPEVPWANIEALVQTVKKYNGVV